MIYWGISANSHDAALSVFSDNTLLFASHAERFSRIKNDPNLSQSLVNYALQLAGPPSCVFWYEKPILKSLRQIYAGQGLTFNKNNIKQYLNSYGITAPIHFTSHHLSHAAAAYYTSPFDKCAVLCIDSIGEWNTTSIWRADTTGLKKIWTQNYPRSIGLWYSAMTQRIGLKPQEDEYILMGMAAYGTASRLKQRILDELVNSKVNLHRGCLHWAPELNSVQDILDIAAATQEIYTDLFDQLLEKTKKLTGLDNIALAGGCALNCSANPNAWKYFKDVWIFPNPGDAGSAIGAVLAHQTKKLSWPTNYLGYDIKGEYPIKQVLNDLLDKRPVGIANGQAEFGPRALGNRSLLADPRTREMRDKVNKIKQRQMFRPFAPAILEEFADEYFDLPSSSRFMQYAVACKMPEDLKAVIHHDNTSRVQTVPNDGSGFRKLLEAWYEKTKCPVLLNTSLNIKGQPIVNNEKEAKVFEIYYGVNVYLSQEQSNT
jgi:carbamoyltransferase